MSNLTLDLSGIVDEAINAKIKEFGLDEKLDELLGVAVQRASKMITVKRTDGTEKKMGVQHKQFERILRKVSRGDNLMLKGEAGNGKTYVAEQVAEALGLNFHAMSVNNQSTKTDIMGFVDANGVYRHNGFITAFRDGGIFCLDEVDAGNPNVLTSLNSALSNGFVECPNGEFIEAHKNFRCIATANTVGRGGNSRFVGRNKLDGATLDRFGIMTFELDEDVELAMLGGNKQFHKAIKAMRPLALKNYDDVVISQRSSIRLLESIEDGDTVDEALEYAVFKGIDEDIVVALTKEFKKHYKAEPKEEAEYEARMEEADKADEVNNEVNNEDEDDDDFDW
jgi:MoxR-like ATPase